MTKKMISWLAFMAVFLFLLHSCVHDEIYSSSDPASREYHSKSVFKEDEKYIKNVMDIYFENEEAIKKTTGAPLWDYAMTMGTMDESFLIVPVADGKTVITCLQVPRNGNYVRFLYDNDREHIKFFQNYLLSEKREPVKQEPYSNPTGKGLAECKVTAVSMWYPADEYGSNAGYWETNYIITCPPEQTDGDGNESGPGDTTYPYPGGGGNPNPQNPKTPCEKTKNLLTKPDVQAVVSNLKNHLSSGAGGEKGWRFNKAGAPTETTQNSGHSVNFGNPSTMNGGYHNHTGTGVDIFSATDISTLIEIARYQSIGHAEDAFVGIVAPNDTHYVIYFNGNHADLPILENYSETQLETWNIQQTILMFALAKKSEYYQTVNGKKILNDKGLERIFYSTLGKMGLENKIILQKIADNNVLTINQNADGTIIPVPCNN
ncbi:hypothetical protein [Chryseobacterium sp. EO14]|uniref:hypothetical protein n=1 Tax=Chryseobacterium sp. EO14 TaxID=2950551 RepID=UPI00210E5CE5|nr:hypothetical protein [Chryseobacterium sp. EO14]MCQ4140052.1 hypothetical protein [Chryseobacterium sp. EO14]